MTSSSKSPTLDGVSGGGWRAWFVGMRCPIASMVPLVLLLFPAVFAPFLSAPVSGKPVFVGVTLPEANTGDANVAAALANLERQHAAAVFLLVSPAQLEDRERLAAIVSRAMVSGLDRWLAVETADPAVIAGLAGAVPEAVSGIMLLLPSAAGRPLPPSEFTALLALKRQGDRLGEALRELRRSLPRTQQLAVAVQEAQTAPETAPGSYVPVRDLVRDGTLDAVWLLGASQFNYHRLRLLRDRDLAAGTGIDVRAVDPSRVAAQVQCLVLESQGNATCDAVFLLGEHPLELLTLAQGALSSWEQEQVRRAAVEAAIAAGRLSLELAVDPAACNDRATLHGVAQSLVPSRDGACPLVAIHAAVRGARAALPPPVVVELRADADGRPGEEVLGRGEIAATAFGHEPAYAWGRAAFAPAVPLKQGRRYWLYIPDVRSEAGTYVWRMQRNGAREDAAAWSERYDYGAHLWAVRVYLEHRAEE